MNIQDFIERGREELQRRENIQNSQVEHDDAQVERAKAAIHEKALAWIPADLHAYVKPLGVMSYMHMGVVNLRWLYWAEEISAPEMLPVVYRFDVGGLNKSYGYIDSYHALLEMDFEQLKVEPYDRHGRYAVMIAQPVRDLEEPSGWRWDYYDGVEKDEITLAVVLAQAAELYAEIMPGFFASLWNKPEEPVKVEKTLSRYERWTDWLDVSVDDSDKNLDRIAAMLGIVLCDIASSLYALVVSGRATYE